MLALSNVAPQVQVPVVQERVSLFEFLVILLCCPLALLSLDFPQQVVKRIDFSQDPWNIRFHELCQPETLLPSHISNLNHILQQLDHLRLDPRSVTKRPLASLVRKALQLDVQPKPVSFWVSCSVELDAQALVVEGVEHILQRRPMVSITKVLAIGNVHRLIHSALDCRTPIKTGGRFCLS